MLGNQDDGVLATGDDVGALNGDSSQLGSVGIAKIVGPLALYRCLFGCYGKIVLSGDSGVRSGDLCPKRKEAGEGMQSEKNSSDRRQKVCMCMYLYDSGCVIILVELLQGQETRIVTVETSDSLQLGVAVLLDDGRPGESR